ncbi:Hint domain-containing protein [Paracoccus isoporae]|uniref:Hint domain-containing protein n=1 Tax=Paracoccus isoporae TaxID=591205 RepID=A0A1G7BIR4_9RHOB|nr:Hint domain-containing protein [Paracoccus isoporae]SDE27011.1 Hint domain-containing protein [Paracoccus isoporae]
MKINLIKNGDFELKGQDWSGNDHEVNPRQAYFGGTVKGWAVEMDGSAGEVTTVYEQNIAVPSAIETELQFLLGLRKNLATDVGEGARVEILDSTGAVLVSQDVLPTANAMQTFKIPVEFTEAGTYTVRFTELGPQDGLGAVLDDVALMLCFAGETRIDTSTGSKAARDIRPGDQVRTASGLSTVRWVGCRRIETARMDSEPRLRPVKIAAGALGNGLPVAELRVSRQHRMLVSSPICQRMFGKDEALVSAIRLTELPGIEIDWSVPEIEYVHLLFDEHEIVFAEGATSESLLLGEQARIMLPPAALDEIRLIFPELADPDELITPARMIPANTQQRKLVYRLSKNGKLPLSAA